MQAGTEAERFESGLLLGKKIGNAVLRNRSPQGNSRSVPGFSAKRERRYGFGFVARTKTAYVKSTEVLLEMEKQLKKAGVLKVERENLRNNNDEALSVRMGKPLIWLIHMYQNIFRR